MKRVSKRYAAALFDYSVEQGLRERVSQDLVAIGDILEQVPELETMAGTPAGARRCRGMLEQAVSPGIHPVTWRFIELLASKRRLTLLPEVVAAFAERCEKADEAISIRLTTAYPLDEPSVTSIGSKIGAAVSRWPRIRTFVNPDLLGGFVASHDDRVYDFSIAGAMQQLRQRLVENAAEPGTAR